MDQIISLTMKWVPGQELRFQDPMELCLFLSKWVPQKSYLETLQVSTGEEICDIEPSLININY